MLFIDDGSTTNACPTEYRPKPQVLSDVSVLKLRRNLGHQRAIGVALGCLHTHHGDDALVVMDADGEDRPEDIPKMLEVMKASIRPIAVFAERGKRLETPMFGSFTESTLLYI